MIPWFLRDPARLATERRALGELADASSHWLTRHAWALRDGKLCVEFAIRAGPAEIPLRLTFPDLYPQVPCEVRPLEQSARLTSHQYGGVDGSLCLEWGPDNWTPGILAAAMVKSTRKLFELELGATVASDGTPSIVPSRHQVTAGQELRSKSLRWYESARLRERFISLGGSEGGTVEISLRSVADVWLALVHSVGSVENPSWNDLSAPTELIGARKQSRLVGEWWHVDADSARVRATSHLDELRSLRRADPHGEAGLTQDLSVGDKSREPDAVLAVDAAATLHLFVVGNDQSLIRFDAVRSDSVRSDLRSPDSRELRAKEIAIVGAGSVGSKIAISLARMGLSRFYLVDHDVLLPENLERHALDWGVVGLHKVDALASALRAVNPEVSVDVSRIHLTGQEASGVVAGVLERVSRADAIVDATASPRVFNLLAATSQLRDRPLIWAEVFAGGVGGLLGRSRPGTDPSPADLRVAFLKFCADNPPPEHLLRAAGYETREMDGEVIAANDADVTVVAGHAASLVGDSLRSPNDSRYPHSLYLVGMRRGWVFAEPFVTVPISTERLRVSPSESVAGPADQETLDFLSSLLASKAT